MAKKKAEGYLSAKESASFENRTVRSPTSLKRKEKEKMFLNQNI